MSVHLDFPQPSLVWMAENTEGFGSDRFCGILVGGECGDAQTLNNWTVSIPDSKPPEETPQMPPEVSKSHEKVANLKNPQG